ncbi:MAG: ethanolamine ammonia-lyase reactivating factor EutA [Deltaproteobacteria bacterium]|nr:ethanolamine ammonia-lyase reactivating factor EutA [Deltaproteobacteria bacterium]
MEINELEILSVGIDVGSSTSHLAFSNLVLKRDERSVTRRFNIEERNIVYEGRIFHTPLLGDNTIDIVRLTDFFRAEYQRAGIDPADIQTGAVIVTGESARKQNARQIAEALSNDAGRFVAATAGPNFEGLIAAMGSGAAARSKERNKTILSCDIGGGTSNIAISINGQTLSTSCISVGGRLLGVNSDGIIWRIEDPAARVMKHLGLNYQIGDPISRDDIERIALKFAEILFEVITGPAKSSLARQLMLTADLDFPNRIDEYSFSGGVAELMYGGLNNFSDIGQILADKINLLTPQLSSPVVELPNKIRATVIGAGAYSLSISGCSGFRDDRISFPLRNVPVIRVDVDQSKLSFEHVVSQINTSFQRFDLKEGEEVIALYFKDPVRVSYPQLELFAQSIEAALANTIKNKLPVILIFETDIACSVGNVMRRETDLKTNLLSLDELKLKEGDWIDIGEPLVDGQVFPVTVKSLVFHGN